MEGVVRGSVDQSQQPLKVAERLNSAVHQQLNLDSIKTRAISLSKAIARIIEEVNMISRSNALPKWQESLNQFSMVNLELYNIVEDIKKVSRAFVVHPKNVNAQNATVLPVMLSSKLLPEMELDENTKREQLLHGLQNLPVHQQIDKLKGRVDMIAVACESAEKVIADTRKAYGLDTRHRMTAVPTLDKAQAAKIQEQESLLRAAVNLGEGLRLPSDQKQLTSALPMHLADVLTGGGDTVHMYSDGSGIYSKITPSISTVNMTNQGTPLQAYASQLHGRSVTSQSPTSVAAAADNTTSPLPYANSPKSGTSMMNAPSPQQQLTPQRQKLIPLTHQQQALAQQQFKPSMSGLPQHQMQFSQSLSAQQFQGRQLPTGHVQHTIAQSQLNQGNQLNRHIQFSGPANSALFSAAQTAPNAPMISNMSATMASQSLLPRMQFGLSGGNQQRSHASPILGDQMFNMGSTNPSSMMHLQQQQQQQQHGSQGAFGNTQQSSQNLQPNLVGFQNTSQGHPNFQQQRQPNQQL